MLYFSNVCRRMLEQDVNNILIDLLLVGGFPWVSQSSTPLACHNEILSSKKCGNQNSIQEKQIYQILISIVHKNSKNILIYGSTSMNGF